MYIPKHSLESGLVVTVFALVAVPLYLMINVIEVESLDAVTMQQALGANGVKDWVCSGTTQACTDAKPTCTPPFPEPTHVPCQQEDNSCCYLKPNVQCGTTPAQNPCYVDDCQENP